MEGESAIEKHEKHGKSIKSHRTRNRDHCPHDATFIPGNYECIAGGNLPSQSVKEIDSHNYDGAITQVPEPERKQSLHHIQEQKSSAQKPVITDPKATLLLTKDPVFIQVKPIHKKEHHKSILLTLQPSDLPKSFPSVRKPTRQLRPCVVIAQKPNSQADLESMKFPMMYPNYKVQFNCRLAKAQVAKTKTNSKSLTCRSNAKITKEFFDEQAKGDGPEMKNRPDFILDTSTTPFVVRRWTSKDSLQENSINSIPDELRQVSRVDEVSPPTFVVERVNFDSMGPKGKPPFKKRQAWKTPPGTPIHRETAGVQYRKVNDSVTAVVTTADEPDPAADDPAPVSDEVDPNREKESSESSDSDDNWDEEEYDIEHGEKTIKSVDARTCPAVSDEVGTLNGVYFCEAEVEDLHKLFLYPNPLHLPLINQTITESPSPKYYSIGKHDDGNPKYIVNKSQVSENLAEFVMLSAPIGFLIQCSIRRDNKGVERGLFPTYYLYLEYEDGRKIFLLSARKRKKSATSNYIICTDTVTLTKDTMVGKLRSNVLGTQFNIFDSGKARKSRTFSETGEQCREELGVVSYEYNLFGLRGPRKFQVFIPTMVNDHQRLIHRPRHDNDNLIGKMKTELGTVIRLRNRSPVWHEDNQSYVLNFNGRVNAASVKNFQLVHQEKEDYTILQFGRTGTEGMFTLDFRYPLCPLQAFALALTSFDNKIACE